MIEVPGLSPLRVRNGGLSALDLVSRLGHVARNDYDLVHGFDHRPTVSLPALAFRSHRGVPYITDWADLWGFGGIADERPPLTRFLLGSADHFWERWTRRAADAVTVINSYLESRALGLGVPPANLRVIPSGADTVGIEPLPKEPMRRKHGLPENRLIAVHSGFAPYDQELLARAFADVARREPESTLLIVGGRLTRFERMVQSAGIVRHVIWTGFRPYPEYAELLSCGDVMLLPYTNRGVNLGRSPNRMGDYMAAGRPTVTNSTGDLGRMVEEEGVGLAADETPQSFADAILRLFQDADLREEMGLRARAVAEQRFAWSLLARELEGFYLKLVPA